MDQVKLAPLVGIVGCLAVLAALGVPYLDADGAAVGTYYSSGAVNPLVGGLLALVTTVVFAAGRQERSDPDLAAGAALVFGLFVLVITGAWALTVRVDAVTVAANHRWVATGVAAVIPLAALWFARARGLF
jgi:hypothetical protein